jgi:cystathionine beta-lyase/cystathionine gamma-synthase
VKSARVSLAIWEMSLSLPKSFSSNLIHVGSLPDRRSGAVIPELSFRDSEDNATRCNFERALAAAEGGQHCVSFCSGSASLACIVHLLKPGDEILTGVDGYGGTNRYLRAIAETNGLTVKFVDTTDAERFKSSLSAKAKLVWLESPTNPSLVVSDISLLAKLVKAFNENIVVCVDNTLMSPYCQRPLLLGADIVSHSVSKFINGHSDVIMGAMVTNNSDIAMRVRELRSSIGCAPSPFDCHCAHRGLKTLAVRMQRHCANALVIAQFLQSHANVDRVTYPGLEAHPQVCLRSLSVVDLTCSCSGRLQRNNKHHSEP